MTKLTRTEKIWEDVFEILSRNYTEDIDYNGGGNFILDDDQRETVVSELTAYVLKATKKTKKQ
jgi:hypothetical protein